VGGVNSGADAIELIMAGAYAVQVCTAAILRGPAVLGQIAAEMAAWLTAHGYTSPTQIRGLALRRWHERHVRFERVPPRYDPARCIGCGRCAASCVYGAIQMDDNKAVLSESMCYGCGLCVTRCPSAALTMAR